jgi:AbrB family looped-hinge helix DNA binding protein
MSSTVGERGQITIEKAIREQLAIYAGDEAVQRVEGGRIVIEIVPGPHRRSLAGMLRDRVQRQPLDESWGALRDAAWATADPAWSGDGSAMNPAGGEADEPHA